MTKTPTQPGSGARLSRRGVQRLDLLLLTIEALDLNGSEAMLWTSHQMGFQTQFPNRVELWKRRCHNPLRRTTRREQLDPVDAESMICLVCAMAERLYPMLHQLLSSREPACLTQQRWLLLKKRLGDLIEERMNLRRGAVLHLLNPDKEGILHHQLISTLALCAGAGGVNRLRATLLDPTP
ncbi:DUF3038 domain-containing protein [Synechococcus sp. M16CYN]|uniref:DUF3038 domain-containing protein n=1 Tax=Synechococcus sp. M16CYN TaxID=3103139 RepID=UPI003342CA8D